MHILNKVFIFHFFFYRAEFRFGGDHGELFYKPPEEFSPLYAHEIGKVVAITVALLHWKYV